MGEPRAQEVGPRPRLCPLRARASAAGEEPGGGLGARRPLSPRCPRESPAGSGQVSWPAASPPLARPGWDRPLRDGQVLGVRPRRPLRRVRSPPPLLCRLRLGPGLCLQWPFDGTVTSKAPKAHLQALGTFCRSKEPVETRPLWLGTASPDAPSCQRSWRSAKGTTRCSLWAAAHVFLGKFCVPEPGGSEVRAVGEKSPLKA